VGAPARFTVETFSAGKGSLEVTVLNPKGQKENVSTGTKDSTDYLPLAFSFFVELIDVYSFEPFFLK
jgi:hypothetical protein